VLCGVTIVQGVTDSEEEARAKACALMTWTAGIVAELHEVHGPDRRRAARECLALLPAGDDAGAAAVFEVATGGNHVVGIRQAEMITMSDARPPQPGPRTPVFVMRRGEA
jgi:hypothetical protein